jgi:hypothetical protein
VGAEARLLLERVRAGELTEDQLRLAAQLGHEPAMACVGEGTPPARMRSWCYGLDRWSPAAGVRACVAVASLLEQRTAGLAKKLMIWAPPPPIPASAYEALLAVQAWILDPTDEAAELAAFEASRSRAAVQDLLARHDTGPQWTRLPLTVRPVVRFADFAGRVGQLPASSEYHWYGAIKQVMDVERQATVQAAIQAELVPWALDFSDPIRERVEAREAAGE